MDKKTKIVIIGGGFGGIYTALNLEKKFEKGTVEVTLINKNNYFLFTPLLHEVATGSLTPASIIESVREVFRGGCIKFIEDTVVEVDSSNKIIKTKSNSHPYDFLVISSGAETNYFNIPGAKENTFPLKNLQDAVNLRNHIVKICEQAVITKNRDLLKFTVVGAGATGVELVAELNEYIQHTLCVYHRNSGFKKEDIEVTMVTATPDIISNFPEKMKSLAKKRLENKGVKIMTNMIVTKVEPEVLIFKDNNTLKAGTLIWVAGVIPSISEIKGISSNSKGRLEVNEFMQSKENAEIFGLGDSAGSFPMLAQVAVKQAKNVAKNIYNMTKQQPLQSFNFKSNISLISVGKWYAIGYFWGLTISGPLMWILWRAVYLSNFISIRKKLEILIEWTINMFYPRDITYIK